MILSRKQWVPLAIIASNTLLHLRLSAPNWKYHTNSLLCFYSIESITQIHYCAFIAFLKLRQVVYAHNRFALTFSGMHDRKECKCKSTIAKTNNPMTFLCSSLFVHSLFVWGDLWERIYRSSTSTYENTFDPYLRSRIQYLLDFVMTLWSKRYVTFMILSH